MQEAQVRILLVEKLAGILYIIKEAISQSIFQGYASQQIEKLRVEFSLLRGFTWEANWEKVALGDPYLVENRRQRFNKVPFPFFNFLLHGPEFYIILHHFPSSTGCSLNIEFFSKNSRKFATSPSPALGCYWLYKKLPANRSDCTLALRREL